VIVCCSRRLAHQLLNLLRTRRLSRNSRKEQSMDAHKTRFAAWVAVMTISTLGTTEAATYRTPNFVVNAPTKEFAEEVGKAAEFYREELAVTWLGKKLPKWYRPCPISVRVGQIGAGGATSFQFDRGEVFGWKMNVQGTEQRILDSVIPHEVSHTIFASYFRRPLPRWADEGAATIIEHESERMRQMQTLKQVTNNGTRYSLRQLLAIKEYPQDMQRVLTLYAQGYSLSDYLIQKKGRTNFLEFLEAAHHHGWDNALRTHYKLKNIEQLEGKWDNWVMAGSPRLELPKGVMVASNDSNVPQPDVVRGQSPDEESDEVVLASAEEIPSDPKVETINSGQDKIAATDENPVRLDPEDTVASAEEIRLQGRLNVLESGWEPLGLQNRVEPRTKNVSSVLKRPPFAESSASASRERPPFTEEVAMKRESPPFSQ
jgi:hypothetical protein